MRLVGSCRAGRVFQNYQETVKRKQNDTFHIKHTFFINRVGMLLQIVNHKGQLKGRILIKLILPSTNLKFYS